MLAFVAAVCFAFTLAVTALIPTPAALIRPYTDYLEGQADCRQKHGMAAVAGRSAWALGCVGGARIEGERVAIDQDVIDVVIRRLAMAGRLARPDR